jgi:uncharacterized protein (TIGR03437 family)
MNHFNHGIAVVLLSALATANGQTFTSLYTFSGNFVYGSEASLVQGANGNFYGTTTDGGTHALGTFFQITPEGALTTLYNFGTAATDGGNPNGVVLGSDGNFYGSTQGPSGGVGTVFQVTPAGTLTTLHTFEFSETDGARPEGLIAGSDGNFYGTTNTGGSNGGGTIFEVTPAGVLTTLFAFTPAQTGAMGLSGNLVRTSDGSIYGTTFAGGSYNAGWVFKLAPSGTVSTVYNFGSPGSTVGGPTALVFGTDGNFYGLTNPGGALFGTIYRLTTGGALTTLHAFTGQADGGDPTALILGANGSFYGLTSTGGVSSGGTVFQIAAAGTFTTLFQFQYSMDGGDAVDLIQSSNGTLYGATDSGGAHGEGTIFSLTLPASGTQPVVPAITSILNAFSSSATIAPNTWVAIKGSNLSQPNDSRIWLASDFVDSQMPTALDNISVSMNGEAAYVYYISPTQLNILTPPDLATGAVQVTVANNGQTSASFNVQAQAESLAFFVFNGGPYVVGTHLSGSDLGPTSLFPGLSTPAQPGEIVVLYGNGFGSVFPPITKGSEVQSGSLTPMPVITIGGIPASVQFAGLVSPGLYQFNVVVPANAANGDNPLVAQYDGQTTQTGVLLTVQSSTANQ